MASDNKVSSFFLLILIGLAIYYLLQRDEFKPLNKLKESFDVDNTSTNYVDNTSTNYVDNTSTNYVDNTSTNYVDNTPTNYVEEVINNSTPIEEQHAASSNIEYGEISQEPYVSQSVINDVAISQQPEESGPVINTNVYNFQANDESELGISGSNLEDAFSLPIPYGTQTDTIDFKKQNVDNYNARDFLPREVNDEWFETDFSLAKYQLNDDKLINTEKYIIGINTVGQSLKNASWDIRGTIPNPKLVVSPWNNSTYEPDFNLKPLC
jgi:hypothetical protein